MYLSESTSHHFIHRHTRPRASTASSRVDGVSGELIFHYTYVHQSGDQDQQSDATNITMMMTTKANVCHLQHSHVESQALCL